MTSPRGKFLDHGMSAIERNLRQGRDETGRIDVAGNFEAAHQALCACVQDVEDDQPWRIPTDCAASAQEGEERWPRPGGEGQRVA
jgi:hypothetical protein